MKQQQGFTLLELMITVAIVGIIAAIAYPSYLSQMQSSRRADGQAALMDIGARQERFFYDQRTYAGSIVGLNAPNQSQEGFYNLSIASAAGCVLPNCYMAIGTATGAQATDANLILDSRGNRVLDANKNGVIDVGEETW